MQNILENNNNVPDKRVRFLRGSAKVAVCWPIVSTWLQDIQMWHKICVLLTLIQGKRVDITKGRSKVLLQFASIVRSKEGYFG